MTAVCTGLRVTTDVLVTAAKQRNNNTQMLTKHLSKHPMVVENEEDYNNIKQLYTVLACGACHLTTKVKRVLAKVCFNIPSRTFINCP